MAETRRYIAAIGNPISSGGAPSYSAEAQQFIDRLSPDPGTTRKNLYATLIDTLVSAGAWTPIDILKVYAADSLANACQNLRIDVLPGSGGTGVAGVSEPIGDITFTVDRGFDNTGAIPGDQIVEHYVPTSNAVHLTTTSATLGVWFLTNHASAAGVGMDGSPAMMNIFPNYAGDAYFRIMDDDAAPAGSAGASDGIGFFLGTRSNSTTTRAYKNKVEMPSSPITVAAASALPSNQAVVCGEAGTGQGAAFIVGGDLDAHQAVIYDALYAYLSAVGAV